MAIIKWKAGAIGNFDKAADWIPHTVPTAVDDAQIASGEAIVTVAAVVHSLTTGLTATLAITSGSFTMTAGTGSGVNAGTISVGNGTTLTVGGTVDNSGTIALDAINLGTGLALNGGVTLDGGGKVTLSDRASNVIVHSGTSSATLTNVDNTIAGAGTIGDAGVALINLAKGVIDATGVNNALVLGASSISNAGILEAAGTAGLVIGGVGVQNASTGVIEAVGPRANVVLQGTRISGGTLKTVNGGVIEASGATFDGSGAGAPINIAGHVLLNTGAVILGTINNTGTIDVSVKRIVVERGLTLQGGGHVTLNPKLP